MAKFGSMLSNQDLPIADQDPDLTKQSVGTVDILGSKVALGTSTQAAIDNIVADINDLKAKLRAAGMLAT